MSSEEKYYFKEELAYTEDHVLVKNLFLINIEEGLEKQQIQEHFEKYGCVEQLHLFPCENKRRSNCDVFKNGTRTGYVVFENPRSAANALENEIHTVNECHIRVQPSYSWFQPHAEKMPDKPENVNPNEKTAVIMKLNDDCLEHIFRQLSQSDRIRFARTCFRFRCIYEAMSPKLDKFIDFEIFKEMTAWEVRDFFQLSGRNVKEIDGFIPYHYRDLVCNFLGKHCINLQSMEIRNDISYDIFKLLANLNSLQNLLIYGNGLTGEDLQAIEHLSQLKKLYFLGIEITSTDHLNYLPKSIETLLLSSDGATRHPEFLIEIFERLPLLKELHIPSFILENPCFEQLISDKCCESLETLSIGCSYHRLDDYNHIAKLPSLRN
ncbi:uncharacterized protein LOC117789987 [Drosophila innubila]|uniref:uncharacterized protein LOC117789987 n=1 Tax=Drosophila innubila TaxID=198719 RepID=UPI00148D4211|nr:uncharacterized protein LOC117789987 [Drosophila innubila]